MKVEATVASTFISTFISQIPTKPEVGRHRRVVRPQASFWYHRSPQATCSSLSFLPPDVYQTSICQHRTDLNFVTPSLFRSTAPGSAGARTTSDPHLQRTGSLSYLKTDQMLSSISANSRIMCHFTIRISTTTIICSHPSFQISSEQFPVWQRRVLSSPVHHRYDSEAVESLLCHQRSFTSCTGIFLP